ncbi:hypothetical protein D1872_154540 [compost metagenome]
MHKKFVKKLSRLLGKHGVVLENDDYLFVTHLELEIDRKREETNTDTFDFSLERNIDGIHVIFHGEVIEDFVERAGQTLTIYPPYFSQIEFPKIGHESAFEELDYVNY